MREDTKDIDNAVQSDQHQHPLWKTECIIQSLALLFVASPAKLGAFSQLVPRVFQTFLRLGSEPRERLNKLLLSNAFDERLEYLIAKTDDLVGAPFFWNDQEGAITWACSS